MKNDFNRSFSSPISPISPIDSFHGYSLHPNLTLNSHGYGSSIWFPASVNIVRGAGLVLISLLGASFNSFMIVAIAPNRRLRTVRNILLVHLGGVGFVSSVFTTMYPAVVIFHGQWLGGQPMCQMYAYVTCVFTSVSVWTIAALSWDKYQTIASPLHHSLTATIRKMLPCFLVFWVSGIILSLPPLFGANEFSFHQTMGICGVNSSSAAGRWYTCILVCLSFIFPFGLMIYCYAHIFRIARTQSSRIAATMLRMVSVIQAPISPVSQTSLSLRGTKAMGTILQLIGSFVLTYLPYAIIILYEVIFSTHANAIFVSIATTLFLAAPCTHAAIYGIRNQILRTSFYKYTKRKVDQCCRSDKRRGSVKSLTRKSSTTLRQLPIKCMLEKDGTKYVLRRTCSYQDQSFIDQVNALPRPHSFDVLHDTEEIKQVPSTKSHDDKKRKSSCKDASKTKEVSFFEKDEISYIEPYIKPGHRYRPSESSFYGPDIASEFNSMDVQLDEVSRMEREEEDEDDDDTGLRKMLKDIEPKTRSSIHDDSYVTPDSISTDKAFALSKFLTSTEELDKHTDLDIFPESHSSAKYDYIELETLEQL